MTRPKRQRPTWLSTWIPFKNGRYLGLARQTILAWISTILALVFFFITLSYALGSSRLSQSKIIYTSQSRTILLLRIFSEAAGLFLAGTVHSTFEVVQWVLTSRPEGIRLPQFLALQPSTGPLGLLVLVTGRGLPPSEWPLKPRFLSLLRLISEIAVPLLGVLIMSNVNTELTYVAIDRTMMPMAFGMEPFNGSVASQLGVMEDMFFNFGYVSFLSNPLHAIDVTPEFARHGGCAKGMALAPDQSCLHKVLIAQEYQNVNANLPLSRDSDSQVVLSTNQQVYFLEFSDNIKVLSGTQECKIFNAGPAFYSICIAGMQDGTINAMMTPCPANLVVNKQCANNTSWRSTRGFSTSFHASYVRTTVAYQRLDGRILWYTVQSKPRPANIDPLGMFNALSVILNTKSNKADEVPSNPVLGSPTKFFGRLVAGHMYRISRLNLSTSIEAHWRGTNALQNLLGITLFYCQNGVLSQTVLPFLSNSTEISNFYSNGAFEQSEKSSLVSFADTRYKLKVGRGTLYAYIVLSGVTLLVCITALVIGSLLELAKLDAEPTLYPCLDFYTQCRVEDTNGKIISAHKRIELAWIYSGRQMFKEIEGLRVTRRKRQAIPLELEANRTDDGGVANDDRGFRVS
ncbi:Nn.00g106700.m01.CDS01 [Neocucurbitaria sp. VM-36]